MTITGPYQFRRYFEEPEDIERGRAVGLEPTRVANNDGSVPIAGTDENGDRVGIAYILPRAPRKRNTPYNAPDDERDAIADRIVAALNSHDALVEALTEARLQIEYLHSKFLVTGTGTAVLAKIDAALKPASP